MQRSSKQEEPQPALALDVEQKLNSDPGIFAIGVPLWWEELHHSVNLTIQKIDGCGDSCFHPTQVLHETFRKGRMVGGCSFEETFRYGNGKQHQVLNENLCHDPEVHGLKGLLQSTPNHKHSASCNEQNTAPSPTVGLCGSMLICVGRHVFPLASSGGSPLERCSN